ncbi:SHOCT domain-containing protein [Cryobacterium fucosi]|uniref:SHOCT domain-containing protein n=1 Tax=Cryobacterium fucosi TaxID=1259157 RepID=A0A4R9BAG8_9MICO|nr:SHOCT domain-containing protein [Cryobacterium fucosi]TFD79175.1 SHOCT domain-containing protein [Cryobacterium fucosi]
MMWGNGYNMSWGWPVGLLMLVAIILLVIWAVRAFADGKDRAGQRGDASIAPARGERSQARQILDDRFAKGELDTTEYRERLKLLEEKAR